MKCTGLKAVSYPDTIIIIKGSTVQFGTNTRIFYIVCYSQLILIKMYTDLKVAKPKEGDKVWIGVDAKPMNPKPAIYKKGKFWDASDNTIELYPTHWKYPNVPFVF